MLQQRTNAEGLLSQQTSRRNTKKTYLEVTQLAVVGVLALAGIIYFSTYYKLLLYDDLPTDASFILGQRYSFESHHSLGEYQKATNQVVILDSLSSLSNNFGESTFDIVPGLEGINSVSFRSVLHPTYYIHMQSDSRLQLKESSNLASSSFRRQASFFFKEDPSSKTISFESVSNPGQFILNSHEGQGTQILSEGNPATIDEDFLKNIKRGIISLYSGPSKSFGILEGEIMKITPLNPGASHLRHDENGNLGNEAVPSVDGPEYDPYLLETSYVLKKGLTGEETWSFESYDLPSQYILHDGEKVYVGKVSPGNEAKASWLLQDDGVSGSLINILAFDNPSLFMKVTTEGDVKVEDSQGVDDDAHKFQMSHNQPPELYVHVGEEVRFNSLNYPDTYLRHQNYEIWQHDDDDSDLFMKDSTFKVVGGLAGGHSYSFESQNYPGYYLSYDGELMYIKELSTITPAQATWFVIPADTTGYIRLESFDQAGKYVRHQGARGKLHSSDGSTLFSEDSSWLIEVRPASSTKTSVQLTVGSTLRFNSYNYPDTYLKYQNQEIKQLEDDSTNQFLRHSSFKVVSGLVGGNSYSFESFDYPGYYLYHEGDLLYIRQVPSGSEGKASWYVWESGVTDYYNVESHDRSGELVRHQNSRGKLHPSDGTTLFAEDSRWAIEYVTIKEREPIEIPRGLYVRFNSFNEPKKYLRYEKYEIWLEQDDKTDEFTWNSTFKVVEGLAGGGSTSFESLLYPGYYLFHDGGLLYIRQVISGSEGQASWYLFETTQLSYYRIESYDKLDNYVRHQDSRGKMQPDDGTKQFHEDAKWTLKYVRPPPEEDPVLTLGQYFRLRSDNYPNDYLRHSNYEIWKHVDDGSELFDSDSSFIVRAGFVGNDTYSFESYNYPGYYLSHEADLLYIRRVDSGKEGQASWNARASDGDFIKLESKDKSGYFIRHQNSRAKLHQGDSSDLFNRDSNFLMENLSNVSPYTPQLSVGQTTRLQSENYPEHYFRHQNSEVWKHQDDGSSLYKYDSTFWVRPGLAGEGSISLESYNYPNYYLYHDNDLLYIRQVASGKEEKASWYERDSTGSYIKLESFDKPGYFARHQNSRGKIQVDDGTTLFDQDSNWVTSSPTFQTDATSVDYTGTVAVGQRHAFEAIDRNDQFWKHHNFQGILDPNTNDPIVNHDYLFDVVEGLAGGGSISFRSVNYPDKYLKQAEKKINLESGSGQQFRNDASFKVKNGFYGDGGVVFESIAHPGHYIAHDQDYRLILKAWDGSQSTNIVSTWKSIQEQVDAPSPAYPLVTGGTIRLNPKGQGTDFFRHQNFEIWIQQDDSSYFFTQDSSFIVEQGLTGQGTVSFRSVNHPTYFVYHDNLYLYLGLIPSGNEGKASFYPRQSSQGNYARFESFDTPEYFIGASNDQGVLLLNDGTSAVNEQISWSVLEQNENTDPYDSQIEIQKTYAFLSFTESNQYWKHSNFALWEVTNNGDVALDQNFQFTIVEGLAGPGTVSFRSVNYPDRYLRESNCDIWLHKGSGILFGDATSFHVRAGLQGAGGLSFESYTSPNHYIRVDGERITLDKMDCCSNFKSDATFYAVEVPTADDEAFSPNDIFVALMDANLKVKVTQEILSTEIVTNANDQILLQLVLFDETLTNYQLFQQTGGTTFLDDTTVKVDISIPFYNFEKGTLGFSSQEVTELVFGIESSQDINFSDVRQVQFDPMGFYRVTVFVTKVVIEASFTATNEAGSFITGTYTMVEYANPSVQVNLIGQASKEIAINEIKGNSKPCINC